MFWPCAVYLVVIGLLSNVVALALPRAWFDPERFPYKAYAWERHGKVYEKLRIQAWKDYMPDVSRYIKRMVRKQITRETATATGLMQLARETCVAECIHYSLILLSGVCGVWLRGWALALLLGVYNLFGNVLFIVIQRYNRPRLLEVAHTLAQRERLRTERQGAAG